MATIQKTVSWQCPYTATAGFAVSYSFTLVGVSSNGVELASYTYDYRHRGIGKTKYYPQQSTLYSDGSSSTNAYSCCRLLWTRDRDGSRILRSATTGTDHLYHAMEEVSLANLPHDDLYVPYADWYSTDFNAFRVTQHYFDALGRETNTVVRPAKTEGAAIEPDFVYSKGWRTSETTGYPDGTSDYSVRTDMRGVRTVSRSSAHGDRDEYQVQVFHPTNPVTPVSTDLSISYRNGATVTQREWAGQWTRDTRLTEYDASGCRIDTQVTEASDHPAVTNSVTLYDFLGRAVVVRTPASGGGWLTTSNTYDGAASRVIRSETTGRPAATHLHDVLGESAGTIQNGITTASQTRYESIDGEIWRVTVRSTSADGVTNAVATTREQMTGLSDILRGRTVALAADGAVTTVERSFNPATKTETTTSWTDGGTPTVRQTKFGALVETRGPTERTVRYYDAFLAPYHIRTFHPVTGALLSRRLLGLDEATWDPVYTETRHGALKVTGQAQFDAWGRETVRTDALGNAVTNLYDALGNLVSQSGATYPVRYGYDTLGRMKELGTTRDGSNFDETRWLYDNVTGLVTNKVYADGSTVAYSYTPDGKPLRTTWARGAWKEQVYNAGGLPAATTYGDATPAVSLAYDAFQRLAAASNAVAGYAYTYSNLGIATNETAKVDGKVHTLTRGLDNRQRLGSLNVGGTQVHYAYDAENRLAAVSNSAFAAEYAYTPDGYDAGYTVKLTNGVALSRSLVRDPYRRSLVTSITNAISGVPVNPLVYGYDLLNRVTDRNTDSFGYNSRSEVTAASILSNAYTYAYDDIGNHTASSVNSVETTYSANSLNQYTVISNLVKSCNPVYDLDGNLITNGVWAYTYDAENRLIAVYSNTTCIVSNAYDHQSRRVLKVTPAATHTFVYDGWNLVMEIQHSNIPPFQSSTNRYVWGKDLSGTMQGAGGVGGLLTVKQGNAWYFPFYDNNGNVTAYTDENGSIVASYTYDAFGTTVSQTGALVAAFPHRFSTKYFDAETGLYYYGYRFYAPELMRWLNRDPAGERGGNNLYIYVRNLPTCLVDPHGLTPMLNAFFSSEKSKYNVTDFLDVSVYCIPKRALLARRDIRQSDTSVCCDGGAIHVVINPRFGVPPNIRPPLDSSGENFFGGGWGKIPDLLKPADEWTTPDDFWGDPTQVGTDSTGPGGIFSYPIYEFKNAKFNVGRFIDIRGADSGAWESALTPRTEMFRMWYKFSNLPGRDDINGIVYEVKSGNTLFIQVGCKGEPTLAWKQLLEIK